MAYVHAGHIDWAWGNNGAPSGPHAQRCSEEIILDVRRNGKSAHDCVIECINEWVMNRDFRKAILWLTKGAQCHNQDAQNQLNSTAGQAVRYAVETYGPQLQLNIAELKIKDEEFIEEPVK